MKIPPLRFIHKDGKFYGQSEGGWLEDGQIVYPDGRRVDLNNAWTIQSCLGMVMEGSWKLLTDMKYHEYIYELGTHVVVRGVRFKKKGQIPRWRILFNRTGNNEWTKWSKDLTSVITEAENKWKDKLPWESAVALMKLREQGCKMLPGWREWLHFH